MTDSRDPIRYTLRFPDAAAHYVSVEARVPTDGRAALELFMPVWTPGSYLIREYSRHVEDVRAKDDAGRERRVTKSRKNRWQVEAAGAAAVTVSYRVYCHEMGVRSNYLERDFGFLNGAATFLTLGLGRPDEVYQKTF
jgi:predicted metalloprotease with PDZ domain